MPLLNWEQYHQPVGEMVARAQKHLDAIRDEKRKSGDFLWTYDVELRVVQLFCDLATVHRRIELRKEQRGTSSALNTDVFDLKRMKWGVTLFEFPDALDPLYVDTSGEELGPGIENRQAITNYLLRGAVPATSGYKQVRERAYVAFSELRTAVLAES